jgi:hypothetical protein
MKKNQRKLLALLLTLILFALSAAPVFANKDGTVIYQQKEIKDLEKIKERIKLKITDDSNFKFTKENVNLKKKDKTDKKDEKELKIIEIGSTSQKIKAVKLKNGKIREDYVGIALVTIGTEDASTTDNASAKSSNSIFKKLFSLFTPISYAGTVTQQESDSSKGVVYEVKLYYSKIDDLYNITSGITKIVDHQDTTIKITRMLNRIGSGMWARYSDGSLNGYANPVYENEKTSSTSFSTNDSVSTSDTNDYWFDLNVDGEFIGSYGEIELKRGTSSVWTSDMNITLGSMIDWYDPSSR